MTRILDVLDGFGFSPTQVKDRVKDWRDEDFERFFAEYVKAVREQDLVRFADRGSTDVFPDSVSGRLPIAVIRQLCIYVNRIYIHDPLVDLSDKFASLDTHFERIIRTPKREDRLVEFRNEFAAVVEQFLELRPLVALGVVHVAPTQLVQARREPGALYASDLYGPTGQLVEGGISRPVMELPPGLADYVNANIRISPAEFKDGRVLIHRSHGFEKPTRTIAVQFADGVAPMVFCLSSLSVKNQQKEAGRIVVSMEYQFDGGPSDLDESTFRHWVLGEAQKYVRLRLNELNTNLHLAAAARAQFLTNVPSSQELITIDLNPDNSAGSSLKTLLEVDLPYLSNVGISELAKARQDEASFQEFRIAFDKAFSELDSIEEGQRQKRIDELVRDVIQAPVSRIDKRLQSLHRNVLVDSVLAIGAFASTILSGGNTLIGIAALATAAKAADSYKKAKAQEDALREESSFFYWEATKDARRRQRKGE
ncbi:MAG: hypothetical protein ABIP48_09380 [Planctomycetota bacterium]